MTTMNAAPLLERESLVAAIAVPYFHRLRALSLRWTGGAAVLLGLEHAAGAWGSGLWWATAVGVGCCAVMAMLYGALEKAARRRSLRPQGIAHIHVKGSG